MSCSFCKRNVKTREHHIIPRCKGGIETTSTCESCESWIHQNFSHNQLRDEFNTVEKILNNSKFQKFLRWLLKQKETTFFASDRSKNRDKHKYH